MRSQAQAGSLSGSWGVRRGEADDQEPDHDVSSETRNHRGLSPLESPHLAEREPRLQASPVSSGERGLPLGKDGRHHLLR